VVYAFEVGLADYPLKNDLTDDVLETDLIVLDGKFSIRMLVKALQALVQP
jgi:hypothetical protein